jgi:hypothetical protein
VLALTAMALAAALSRFGGVVAFWAPSCLLAGLPRLAAGLLRACPMPKAALAPGV